MLIMSPCICTWSVDKPQKKDNVPTASTESHKNHCNDQCHPFCTGYCCVSVVNNTEVIYFVTSDFNLTEIIESEYAINYRHRLYAHCWHPPQTV